MSNRFILEMNIRKYLCWILLVLFRKVRKLFQMNCTVTGSPGNVSQRLPETSRFEEEQNTGTISGPPTRSDASPDATNPTPSGGIDISRGDI